MRQRHWWAIGAATGTGLLGLSVTGGLALLALHFVEEFSRPHETFDSEEFQWQMPKVTVEPPRSRKHLLTFTSSDGTLLRGEFWAQSCPAPTIVICHGYRVSGTFLSPVAAQEYASGYNVLMFDFRGHGDSESVATSGGIAEIRDLEAALAVVRQQPEALPGKIILHGFSMGAAIALLVLPHSDIVAIIADSPYAHLDTILRRLVYYRFTTESTTRFPMLQPLRGSFSLLAWATVAVSGLVFRLRFGHPLFAHPATSFKRRPLDGEKSHQRHIPILLIHASGDTLIPISHAHQIATAAQVQHVPMQTYFVDYPVHCGAYEHNPQQYVQVLQDFIAQYLGEDLPQAQAG